MNTLTEQLKAEIEATASDLHLSPSTVGLRAGQGGKFYDRLQRGKRVWPETFAAVMVKLQEMRDAAHCDPSHGGNSEVRKGGPN